MNRVYKTVWNAVRGQLVVVNEATASHAQADAPSRAGSTVHGSAGHTFTKAALAVLLAAALGSPLAFASEVLDPSGPIDPPPEEEGGSMVDPIPDTTVSVERDRSAGVITAGNVTITETGGLTMNKAGHSVTDPDEPVYNENTALNVEKTLTNAGYLRGDSKVNAAQIVNQATGEITMGTVTITKPAQGADVINNAGTLTADTLVTGQGNVVNTGSMTVKNAYDLQGKLTNSGTQLKLGTVNVTGEIINEAATGVTVDVLNLTGTGHVTGTGTMAATGAVNIAAGAGIAQGGFEAAGVVTNEGTMNVAAMKQTDASGSLVNKKTATFETFDGLGTITNEAGATLTVNQALNASGTLTNTGTMTVGTLSATGTVTNSKTATITTLEENGSVVNDAAGTMNVTGAVNVQKSLQNLGAMDADTINVKAGTFTNTGARLAVAKLNVEGGTLTNNAASGAEVGTLNVTQGSVGGTGTLLAKTITLADGTALAQTNLAADTLDIDGTMNITEKLTAEGVAEFKANAKGTVASADMGADLTHQGTMVFDALDSESKIDNNAGTLTIKTLTGVASVTNAQGATLDLTAGNAQADTLVANGTTKLNTADILTKISNAGQMTSTGNVETTTFEQTAGKAALHSLNVAGGGLLNVTGGELAVAETLRASHLTNASVVNTKDLIVESSLNNSKTLTSTERADIYDFTQTADGIANLHEVLLNGTGEINGALTASGELMFDIGSTYTGSGTVTANDALIVEVDSNVALQDKVTVSGDADILTRGSLKAKGLDLQKANLAGKLVNEGAAGTIADLNMEDGAQLQNNDALTVGTLSNASGVTYSQTGANGSIAVTDGTWFANSTIQLTDGKMDRTAEGLGLGNTYKVQATGAGQIPDAPQGDDWKDGMSVLKVGALTTDSTVELLHGGLLEADDIALDQGSGTGKTLKLQGGAVETTLDQIFEGLRTEALNYETVDGDGKIQVSGATILGVTDIGDVQADVAEHAEFTTGDLVFRDSVSLDLVQEVSQKINAVSNGNMTIHYTGPSAQVFTAEVANSLIDANDPTKIIFDNSTLYARDDANPTGGKTLYVGGEAPADGVHVKGTIGFSNVIETEKVVVQGGKGFALVGRNDAAYGSLVGTNGSVDVTGTDSEFVLGTTYRTDMTGSLASVTVAEGGKLLGKGGDYKVGTITATSGTVETMAGNKLATDALTLSGADSKLDNGGQIVAQSFTDSAESVSTNGGVMQVAKDTAFLGNFTNKTGGSVKIDGRLTVSGKLVNEASQLTRAGSTGIEVQGLDVASESALVNEGFIVSTGTNNITGGSPYDPGVNTTYAFHNKAGATADLSHGETVIGQASGLRADPVEVTVVNEGTMKLGDVTLLDDAALVNKGEGARMTAGTISIGVWGILENFGTLDATKVDGYGIYRNAATTVADEMRVSALKNEADASKGEGVVVRHVLDVRDGGQFSNGEDALVDASEADVSIGEAAKGKNAGIFLAKRMALAADSTFENEGEAEVTDLELADGADYTNAEGGKALHKTVAVAGGKYVNEAGAETDITESLLVSAGSFENHGKASVMKSVEVSGTGEILQAGDSASMTVAESLTVSDEANFTMTGGKLAVTKGVDFKGGTIDFKGESGAVEASLMLKGEIEGTLNIDSAKVTVGKWSDAATASASADDIPSAAATLIADTAPLTLGIAGKLAVGSGAREKAAAMKAGSAWFGGDSLFVLDTSKMTTIEEGGSAALVGNGKGDLVVEDGAKLHVGNVGWGDYYVTKDFASEVLKGWDSITPNDPAKSFEVKQDEDGNVILTVGTGDIQDKLPEVAVDDIVNEVITNPDLRDPNRDDVVGFVSKAVEDGILDVGNQGEVINTVSQIGAAGGLMTENLTLVENVADRMDRHASFEDVHFRKGQLQAWEGVRFWADAVGQKTDVKGADYSGSVADFEADNVGFLFGADFMGTNGLRYGAAFGYQKGDVESKDALITTTNKADAYSVTGFVAKDFGNANVIGTVGYTHVEADLSQTLPSALGIGKHTLDAKTDVLTFGVRGEGRIAYTDTFAAIPYAGVRVVAALSSDDASKMGGKRAFGYDTGTLVQVRTPIGVSFEGTVESASGWNHRGLLDLSVTPVFGDIESETTVSMAEVAATDRVTADVSDRVTGALRVGYAAEKDGIALGGDLGVSVGDTRKSAVTFGLSARYRF